MWVKEENKRIVFKYLDNWQPWIRFEVIDEWPQWRTVCFWAFLLYTFKFSNSALLLAIFFLWTYLEPHFDGKPILKNLALITHYSGSVHFCEVRNHWCSGPTVLFKGDSTLFFLFMSWLSTEFCLPIYVVIFVFVYFFYLWLLFFFFWSFFSVLLLSLPQSLTVST